MKRLHTIVSLIVLSVSFISYVEAQMAATPGAWFTPQGREAVGSGLLPFASQADALAGDISKSPYIQPLGGAWKMKVVAGRDQVAAAIVSDAGWQDVQVPRAQAMDGKVALLARSFKRPFVWDGREIFVRLQGVGAPYEVYVNGKFIGYNPSPAVGTDFDVTKATAEGNNALVVVLYNDFPAAVALAAQTRMIVEGDAFAFSQPRARLRDVEARTGFSPEGNGLLDLGVIVKTHLLNVREIEVFYELHDAAGKTVASGRRTAEFRMKQEDTVRFFANIPAAKPWSAAHPDLYTLLLKTQYEGRFGEYVAVPVGFREVKFVNGKLLVNGAETPLTVAAMQPSRDLAAGEESLRELKKQGTNTIKLASPASPAFYSLCDRVGIYVCDQAQLTAQVAGADSPNNPPARSTSLPVPSNPATPFGSSGLLNTANDPALWPLFADRIATMYDASKGHPSVVAFSPAEGTANGFNLYRAYLTLRRAERTRPVSFAGAGNEWNSDTAPDGTHGRLIFKVQ